MERESHGAFKGVLGTDSFSEETWTYSLSEDVLISIARRRSRRSFSWETGRGVEDWFAPILKAFYDEESAEMEAEGEEWWEVLVGRSKLCHERRDSVVID